MTPPLLQIRGLCKAFPGVQALSDVGFDIRAGEVLALMGENGAGKSTLIKILGGIQSADSGEVLLDGAPVKFRRPMDALAAGIGVIHQELVLADNLDIAANILLGREPRGVMGLLRRGEQRRQAETWMRAVGLDMPASTSVGMLSVGHKQMVEIAKALSLQARLLIMDEPTASLSAGESERLFGLIEGLRAKGVAIVYVSHRLPEVARLADRAVVLRDGKFAGELARDELVLPDNIIRLMVGRDIRKEQDGASAARTAETPVLEVEGVQFPTCREPASFRLHRGEVLGLAGLVGAGRTELAGALFGVAPSKTGTIKVDGRPVSIRCPADAIEAGIALVPEDRKQQGLVLEMMIRHNTSLPGLAKMAGTGGLLPFAAERKLADEQMAALRVKAPSSSTTAGTLSGGNQQKVVLGKWLALRPKVLILDEPTRGIDVGAKGEIHALIRRLAAEGLGVLMISSDMEEVLAHSDRLLVMHEGRLAGELPRERMDEQAVMRLAAGMG